MAQPQFILWRRTDRHFLVLSAVLVVVLAMLITLLYVVFSVRKVEGPSMEPTLIQGDRVLETKGYDAPSVGDVVSIVTVDKNGARSRIIKRVVAVPGDTVEVLGDVAYVNGEVSAVAPHAIVGGQSFHLGPMTVPDGSVYVLGDNRPVSLDSRYIGFIPLGSIRGKAIAVIFPPWRVGAIDE